MSCPSVQGWISGIRDHGVKLNTELTFSDPEPRERRRQATTGRVVTVTRDNRRSSVPLLWRYVADEVAMNLLAGFIGVGQHPSSLAVRPEIGWAVQPQPSTSL